MAEQALYQTHKQALVASALAFLPDAEPARIAAAFDKWLGQTISFADFAQIYTDVTGELPPQDYDSTPEAGFFNEYLNSNRSAADKAVATLMALAKNNGMYRHNTAAALVAANAILYAANAGLVIIAPADAAAFTENIRLHYVRDHVAITNHIKDDYLINNESGA
ncbi:hypothetical protein [Lacticaseibacillus jixiensis]|uniref:hypothetical protein n=1 Tax=Lacticaseibacillus jixiensis TaxID=3231926 RepID=UPI0036F2726E